MNTRLSILLLLIIIVGGCGNERLMNEPAEQVPIHLRATPITNAQTRAPIELWKSTPINVLMYTTEPASSDRIWAAVVNTSAYINLTPSQEYDSRWTYYFKGFHPQAVPTGRTVNYTLNGQKDIMISDLVSGTRANPAIPTMTFQHLLTRLDFRIRNSGSFPNTLKVMKIEVLNSPVLVSLNLDLSYTNALTVNDSYPSGSVFEVFNSVDGVLPTTTAFASQPVLCTVMLPERSTFDIRVLLSDGTTTNVTGISYPVMNMGTVYYFDLTFTATTVSPSLSVSVWEQGNGTGPSWVGNSGSNW